jgi:hypothetical protein
METLEELVAQRKGYKYLSKDGVSPYQDFQYNLRSKKIMKFPLDEHPEHDCGEGCNLATLKWIADNCLKLDGVIVECTIPENAKIIVPHKSDGKFRTDAIRFSKIHKVESAFPALKGFQKHLAAYKPINPIQTEEMPAPDKIKPILLRLWNQVGDQVWNQVWDQVGDQVRNQVGDQVRDQVGNQVWDQVWNQVWNQVWDQVGDQVWNQVRNQVGDQVGDQVWNQVRNQVGDQVRNQVWDQVGCIAYYAVKLFMNLPYEHPAFDLIRLGVIAVNVLGKFKIFGKGGKFLGEFDESEVK